jgi:N-acetylmuramoyl-L-alanine amidase
MRHSTNDSPLVQAVRGSGYFYIKSGCTSEILDDLTTGHLCPQPYPTKNPCLLNDLRYYYVYMQSTPPPVYSPPTIPPARLSSSRPRRSRVGAIPSTLAVAILVATLFTAWTPAGLFSGDLSSQLAILLTAQPQDQPLPNSTARPQLRVGIVSGHWGNDSGAVCPNGTTEAEVNQRIATLVQQKLDALGLQTDLLQEFDPRLQGYRAVALVSIHNDSCEYINDQATGFKVAAAMSSRDTNLANRLAACLRDRYQRATGLPLHNSVTNDMTFYHGFNEIDHNTTAAIIEAGFLNLDYKILTEQPDLVATGIVNGILCFVNNENIAPTPVPTP